MEIGGLAPHIAEAVAAFDDEVAHPRYAGTGNQNRNNSSSSSNSTSHTAAAGSSVQPRTSSPPSAPRQSAPPHSVLLAAVAAMCIMYMVFSGVENGVAPAALTTMEEQLNASTTAVTTAQSMAEVTKVLGSLVFGSLGGTVHKPVFLVLGCVIWTIGAAIVGFAGNVAVVGVGAFVYGIGYSALITLDPSILDALIPSPSEKHRVPFYLGITYTASSVGVVLGFVICGLAVDSWRLNFFFAPILLVPAVAAIMYSHSGFLKWRTEEFGIGAAGGALSPNGSPTKITSARDFVNAMKGNDVRRPSAKVAVLLLLRNRPALFTVISQTFQFMYSVAFITLLPKFVEEGVKTSKSTASYVLAGTIPVVCFAIFSGGYLCKRQKWNMVQQLRFCFFTNVPTIPLMAMFFINDLAPFVAVMIFGMFFVFLSASPSVSLLAILANAQHDIAVASRNAGDEQAALEASVIVSVLQGLGSFSTRIFGSVPGPIILGALIDQQGPSFPLHAAYVIVGGVGTCMTTLFAWLALRAGEQYYTLHQCCVVGGGGGETDLASIPTHVKGTTPLMMSPTGGGDGDGSERRRVAADAGDDDDDAVELEPMTPTPKVVR